MVASKRFPLKTLLLSAGLSASLALLGCATNGLSTSSRVTPIPGTGQTTSQNQPAASTQQPAAQAQQRLRSDWSSDRILYRGSFRTASFVDAIKPSLDLPAVERGTKDVATSDGLANSFAKNLPGAGKLDYLPNTPARIGTNTYFLTASETSTNAYALNASGNKLWDLSLHENGSFDGTSPAVGRVNGVDVLYAVTDEGRLYAINASTGLVINFAEISEDEFHHASPFVRSSDADSNNSDPVFLASDDGKVYRYTFNGSTFSQVFGEEIAESNNLGRFSTPPLATDTHVYVGSEEGKFYKLDAADGDIVSELDLSSAVRADGCQVMATPAIDGDQDIALVPCGGYLFKIRLNDGGSGGLALAAQSPLLELRDLLTFKPTRVLGPNHNTRPQLSTTVLRDPLPTETTADLEQTFGFKEGDFVRVETSESGNLYAEIDTLSDEGTATFKGDGLYPLASPTPDPILFGAEKLHLANWTVRPEQVDPDPEATPFPTPTPYPDDADETSRFPVGKPENLSNGDYLRFPTLPGQPVVQICSSSNALCDLGNGSRISGIERFVPEDDDDAAVFYITVPGDDLQEQIEDEMEDSRYVPFEKLTNQVVGDSNSAQEFELASVKDFKAGDTVRVVHQDDGEQGRFEYGTVEQVSSSNRTLRLVNPLIAEPEAGDSIEIIDSNDRAFGRVTPSQAYSNGNILSEPVLRGNGQEVYLQHGNTLYELNYASDTSFRNSANYLVLQAGRLDQSNVALSALSRSRPRMLGTEKLVTVDTDPSSKTGIFLNRVLLPLSSSFERLNDIFPILAPNSLGQLPNRAETQPVDLTGTDFFLFGGGNGVAYKLHKDKAW